MREIKTGGVDRSHLESVNSELNERLTSLKSVNDSLASQLSDANSALTRVMLITTHLLLLLLLISTLVN